MGGIGGRQRSGKTDTAGARLEVYRIGPRSDPGPFCFLPSSDPLLRYPAKAAADTKGEDARTFPFALAPDLKRLLEAQWVARDGLFVFHRDGRPIRTFRRAWDRATARAGLAGRLVHDLRRTAARDFRRQGVSEGEIMKLCGWKTRAMFDRYNIIDEAGSLPGGRETVWHNYGTIGGSHDDSADCKFKRSNFGGVAQLVRAAES